eukprot:gene1293-1706_t
MVAKCVRHSTAIIAIDFSSDGEWLRSNSQDRELCFFNSDDGTLQSNIASMRDIQWASNNCIYSWHINGLHRAMFATESVLCAHTPSGLAAPVEYLACGSNL